MGVIKRLDHIIVAVHDRRDWIPVVQRVLDLQPGRMLEGAGEGAGSFSNAEFAIGDGFLGVVEPSGEDSQLHRFLARSGEGFYGMSIDVGDVAAATSAFDACGAVYRGVAGHGLVWLTPRSTHGVLYQVIGGMLLGQGANPRYRGLSRMTVVVSDLDRAVADYQGVFGLGPAAPADDDRGGFRGAALAIEGSALGDTIVLAEPRDRDGLAGRHLGERGEGIYSFGITVSDLPGELRRLDALGVGTERVERPGETVAHVDPAALKGLRIELVAPRTGTGA